MVAKIKNLLSDFRLYWNIPMPGRHMPFKEIAAYSGGGIGAYMIITLGSACILGTGNTLISQSLGVKPTDMYILYLIAVLANIPFTGIRAKIIDNTRNKAGKYRPYIVSMAIPTAIVCIAMVWLPYDAIGEFLSDIPSLGGFVGFVEEITKKKFAYVFKCAIILILDLILHFVYYFFYDGYENLIHVLSPDTQERADVSSIKSIVYSFSPTVVNVITPLIAGMVFGNNTNDIRVYRLLYPILGVLGILLCIVVYKGTEEKIVQARTHVIRVKFIDAFREVAKNKYFWIISLAGWIGFLESAYINIFNWLYNYGGACSYGEYTLITTIYGNASLWGMLLAPFCIRRWGKKMVLVVTNIFNVVFILMMLPVLQDVTIKSTMWMILCCLYLNAFMGSFALILNPAIQADIRDYQQYRSGERIDGMFGAVGTIGTIITLATSSVLPYIYEKNGLTEENALRITSDPNVLNRLLGDGKTVGELLNEQIASGQTPLDDAYSALYDPTVLSSLLQVLIIFSAVGAFFNIIPYFWYDFNEKKQKSVVSVLKVRAMFEDYGNGITNDNDIVEGIDIIRKSREMAMAEAKSTDKNTYLSVAESKKAGKKAYRAALKHNDEIEIAKFVCAELDKFSAEGVMRQVEQAERIYAAGINSLLNMNIADIRAELKAARAMPKNDAEEKELRKSAIEIAKNKLTAYRTIRKHYKDAEELIQPDFSVLEGYFNREDEIDAAIKALYIERKEMKKENDSSRAAAIMPEIKALKKEKDQVLKAAKLEMDKHTYFNRAAKPYLDAEKLIKQRENYTHLDDIAEKYDEAKARREAAEAERIEKQRKLDEEKAAHKAALKAEKEAAKASKGNK